MQEKSVYFGIKTDVTSTHYSFVELLFWKEISDSVSFILSCDVTVCVKYKQAQMNKKLTEFSFICDPVSTILPYHLQQDDPGGHTILGVGMRVWTPLATLMYFLCVSCCVGIGLCEKAGRSFRGILPNMYVFLHYQVKR
jgi:hypothetical protein